MPGPRSGTSLPPYRSSGPISGCDSTSRNPSRTHRARHCFIARSIASNFSSAVFGMVGLPFRGPTQIGRPARFFCRTLHCAAEPSIGDVYRERRDGLGRPARRGSNRSRYLSGPLPVALPAQPSPVDYPSSPTERLTFGIAHQDEHLLVVETCTPPPQPGKGTPATHIPERPVPPLRPQLQNLGKARDFGFASSAGQGHERAAHRRSKPRPTTACEDFEERRIRKFYWALCTAAPKPPTGVIRLPILEDSASPEDRAGKPPAHISCGQTGDHGVPHAGFIGTGRWSRRPITGRLHQVRLQTRRDRLSDPGDAFYGPRAHSRPRRGWRCTPTGWSSSTRRAGR